MRFLIDQRILLQSLTLDSNALQELLAEAELLWFERQTRALLAVWFGEGEMTEELYRLHRYVLSFGIYGTYENRLAGRKNIKEKGRVAYVLARLFPKPEDMARYYPVLQRHKWLLPLFYLIRPFHRLFTTGAEKVAHELHVQATLSEELIAERRRVLEMLGMQGGESRKGEEEP